MTSHDKKKYKVVKESAVDYKREVSRKNKEESVAEYSPAWVVLHPEDASGYKMELIERIRSGVRRGDWKQLIFRIGFTEKDFEFILPASISTMQKREVYDQETSERIYEISRLFGLGYEVFDSPDQFKSWLMTPSRALGNKKPFEFLDSSLGFELVESEIIRIQYNVYS